MQAPRPRPSSVKGKVKAIHIKPGDDAGVGQAILTVEAEDGAGAPRPPEGQAEKPAGAAPPREAAPLPAAPPAPAAKAPVPPQEEERPAPRAGPAPAAARLPGPVPAAPSVRRLAREAGVDIGQVPGTGPGGRISAGDVKSFARQVRPVSGPAAQAPVQPPLPDFSKWGPVEAARMDGIRQATARSTSRSWSLIPHVTQFDRADVTELEDLRKKYAPKAEAAGGKLTVTAVLLKVAAAALRAFPKFNASVDAQAGEVIYKKYVHVGVAVDTERGLLVPVIRDADKKNILQLARELAAAAQKARGRKLALDEMQGGCFTITNLGGIGGAAFTPIVNWPEVAILGVARAAAEAVWREGAFQPRLMLPLALSYDHRLIDGADGARFLRWICEALEEPFLLPLEG
ncbi:MAG: 2-oxo acid dehydrogenase subunit E2 [Candidatus Tectomicrobia bacterium]|nr:2-oxo acid dehydrogenase subunit E2 [Candidatus Tectomicrobia bacterium]